MRNSFFAGETFIDLTDAQRRVVIWVPAAGWDAGARHDPGPARRGLPVRGAPRPWRQAPQVRYDLPLYATVKVHRDHHLEVGKALYSVPGNLIGQQVKVRADSQLVRIFARRGSW